MGRWQAGALLLAALAPSLAGCRQFMIDQPKLKTYAPAQAFPNDAAARALPVGVIDRDALARAAALETPPPVDAALVARGRERYDIYCAPCHGASGHGDGMIVERGFPKPPSYHEPRLIAAPAQHYIDVITRGWGVMYSYATRVPPRDRWAIVAYIRALQLSQSAKLAAAVSKAGRAQ